MNTIQAAVGFAIKARAATMSTVLMVFAVCWLTATAHAHELQPAIADVTVSQNAVQARIELALEPMVLGMDLEGLEDTDDASESDAYDALRELAPDALQAQFATAWPAIAPKIRLLAGDTPLDIQLDSVTIPPVGDAALTRLSTLKLTASLPADNTPVRLGWTADLGSLIVRQLDAEGVVGYAALLPAGADSEAMPRTAAAEVGLVDTLVHYTVVGFEHIIPKGLDHIVFVLGLFFFSLALKPLIWQVTAFTLAHSVTLALASLGVISVPASVVEPLIALSIAYVAFENLRGGEITWVRTAVVFAFGLLHGLGFAFVLGDVGLPPSQFLASLFAFNVGVELGQLAVIAVAYLALGLPFGKRSWYRRAIAIPCSLAIGALGVYWTVERVFF